jgi:predicted nucleic acid-binding protein
LHNHILSIQANLIDPFPDHEPALRDINDQPVLGTLLAARRLTGADYLVTGDKDLLTLAGSFPIVSPAQFWSRHGSL